MKPDARKICGMSWILRDILRTDSSCKCLSAEFAIGCLFKHPTIKNPRNPARVKSTNDSVLAVWTGPADCTVVAAIDPFCIKGSFREGMSNVGSGPVWVLWAAAASLRQPCSLAARQSSASSHSASAGRLIQRSRQAFRLVPVTVLAKRLGVIGSPS